MGGGSFMPSEGTPATSRRHFDGMGEAEYRLLIERNADGIVVVNQDGIVVFTNPAAAEIFGRSIEDLMNSPVGIPAVAGETTEIVVLRPGGGRADVEMRAVATSWDDRPALLASLRDISVRREMEGRERQTHKMEAVGRLTAGIAHDFNNLLTVVIGNLEFLQRQAAGDAVGARTARYAANAMHGARRAATLTQQLLAFSRRQPLTPNPVDVNHLLAGMSDLLVRTLGEGIRIERKFEPSLGRTLADANQLEAAILNLSVNARDAMPNGGVLTLETAHAVFGPDAGAELAGGPCVRVSVYDSGCGMSDEVLAQVFEPFFTTKGVGHGTGLGLSQVYGFVTQSGGQIRIDSNPDRGTAVHLYLPRSDAEEGKRVEGETDDEPRHGACGQTILVVEDDEDVRAFSAAALRDLGYRVLEATDGSSAMRILERSPETQLLFSDIGLPGGMNGRELADVVRAKRPDLQVLLTTAYAGGTLVKDGRLEPRIQLLSKPFTCGALAAKIENLLATRQDPPCILLVEDDALVRMTVVQTLLDAGCRVEEAATAGEALQKIRSRPGQIDAAVIDIGLPDGKGDALVSELRATRADVPVVLASGYSDGHLRERFPAGQGVAFLDKPFDGCTLRKMLRSLGIAGL